MYHRARVACLAAALSMAAPEGSLAQSPIPPSDAEACLAANRGLSLGAPLPRVTARLKAGGPDKDRRHRLVLHGRLMVRRARPRPTRR